MLLIGLNTATFRQLKTDHLFRVVEVKHLEALEWAGDCHLKPGDLKMARMIREQTDALNVALNSYGFYYRFEEHQSFERKLETAAEMGASFTRVWAGNTSSNVCSDREKERLVQKSREAAALAKDYHLQMAFEYHRHTLTDSVASTSDLLKAIDEDNVTSYWQPLESLTINQRLEDLNDLLSWISNVHVFHWKDYHHRYSLDKGEKEWSNYLPVLEQMPRAYFLEFVKKDQIQQFKNDLITLRQWQEKYQMTQ